MLSAPLPVGRSCVLSFKSLTLILSAKCLPTPLLAIKSLQQPGRELCMWQIHLTQVAATALAKLLRLLLFSR